MCKCSGTCGCNITSTTKGEKGDASPAATLGYKVYKAIISQSGTSAPTVTVLQNTLGGTVVFTYSGVGSYVGTLTGAFTNNKTFFLQSNRDIAGLMSLGYSDANSFVIESVFLSAPTTAANDVISLNCIEIQVYP